MSPKVESRRYTFRCLDRVLSYCLVVTSDESDHDREMLHQRRFHLIYDSVAQNTSESLFSFYNTSTLGILDFLLLD
jgi:hypothetical protein